ncbi:phage tail protein [Rubellimicrobium aerolatum]|uniref:Phage tail protein n=1 Tax=Rubellimicrobium aerolatum TaxID=490979 RepID=A0ABW0SET1_9RHOB|nr:phage tail protein [Rubellimicrobium aerolatum]MBP1806455.1 hypothetical protein [Rubellimicrobium aerolatum]
MPQAAGAFVVASLGLTGASAVVVGGLVQVGVGLAASSLARALTPQSRAGSAGGIATDVTMEGGTLPQTLILGRTATAGVLVAPPYALGRAGDIKRAFRWSVIDISDHPIERVRAVWVDGQRFWASDFSGDIHTGHRSAALPSWSTNPESLRLRVHDGRQAAADPLLLDRFGSHAERPWQASMVGRGVAYGVWMHRYDPDLHRGEPQVLYDLEGARVWDRRLDGSEGGAGPQRLADPATWAYSNNPVTLVAAILRGLPLADGTSWGLGVEVADLPQGPWVAAADHCDELVDGAARYRAGIEARLATAETGGDEPFAIIDELLKACAGAIADCGGTWVVRSGPPGLPVAYLTDDDIVVSRPQDYEPHRGVADVYNAVRATHPAPAQGWASTEAPLRVDADAEAEDGERLVADLALPAVYDGGQVQRLQRLYLRDARRMRRHTITLPPEYSHLLPLDVIAWTSQRNGYEAKLFEVAEVAMEPATLAVTLALREVDPADYDWDAGELLPAVAPSATRVVPELEPLPGFVAEPLILTDAAGTARRAAIRIGWSTALTGVRAVTWEIRVQATGAPAPGGTTANVAAGEAIASDGLVAGGTYEVRARGDATAWTGWATVTLDQVKLTSADIDMALALAGALDETAFAAGISVPRIVTALPTEGLFEGRLAVFGGQIHRYTGGAWTAQVAADQVVGKLTAIQIGAAAIGADQLAARAIRAKHLLLADTETLFPEWSDFSGLGTNDSRFNRDWMDVMPDGNPDAGTSCLRFVRATGNNATHSQAESNAADRRSVQGGKWYWLEVRWRTVGGAMASGAYARVVWYAQLNGPAIGTGGWENVGLPNGDFVTQVAKVQAPASARWAALQVVILGAQPYQRTILMERFAMRRANEAEMIVDGAVRANHVDTDTFAAEGLAIFKGALQSDNYSASAGWRIAKSGAATFNKLIVRGSFSGWGAVSDEWSDERNDEFTEGSATSWSQCGDLFQLAGGTNVERGQIFLLGWTWRQRAGATSGAWTEVLGQYRQVDQTEWINALVQRIENDVVYRGGMATAVVAASTTNSLQMRLLRRGGGNGGAVVVRNPRFNIARTTV